MRFREPNRIAERAVRRFNADAIEEDGIHPRHFEGGENGLHRWQLRDLRIGDNQRRADAEIDEVHPHFTRDAGAEAQARGGHLKSNFAVHVSRSSSAIQFRRRRPGIVTCRIRPLANLLAGELRPSSCAIQGDG